MNTCHACETCHQCPAGCNCNPTVIKCPSCGQETRMQKTYRGVRKLGDKVSLVRHAALFGGPEFRS